MKIQLDLTLTEEDVASIAHFCEDPQAWVEETFARKVSDDILERINSFRPKYLASKEALGEKYMNRAQRKALEDAQMAASKARNDEAEAKQEAEFQRRVNDAVQAALANRA